MSTPSDSQSRSSQGIERRFDITKISKDRPAPTPTPSFGNKKG